MFNFEIFVNRILNITIAILIFVFFSSCNIFFSKTEKIYIKGSDTMLMLTEKLAAEFMKQNPNISIYVDGGGTVAGFKALNEGSVDICMASRNVSSEEVKLIAEKWKSVGYSILIGKDALSVYVNLCNPVDNLNIKEIQDIFTGKKTNWNNFSGINNKITVINRNSNSGTYDYFKNYILEGENYLNDAQIMNTTNAVADAVFKDSNAIGYGGIIYGTNVKHIKINGIEPSISNVKNDSYPIIRYLHFYTLENPKGNIRKFINWILSKDGQQIVEKMGFIPIFQTN